MQLEVDGEQIGFPTLAALVEEFGGGLWHDAPGIINGDFRQINSLKCKANLNPSQMLYL
jgi:hypothetical protein